MVHLKQSKESTVTESITIGAGAIARNNMNTAINSVFWVILKDAKLRDDKELVDYLLLKQEELKLMNKSMYERATGSGILFGIQNGTNQLELVNQHQKDANDFLGLSVNKRKSADEILPESRKASYQNY